MNVFVLTPGRTGSTTFAKACSHMSNFSSGHESLVRELGAARIDYPDDHIEVDNRLSWFLGRLDKKYNDNAFYVYLIRNKEQVAKSYAKRWFQPISILRAFSNHILFRKDSDIEISKDYVNTIEENIDHFLKDKSNKMTIELEQINTSFPLFWEWIGAEGNLKNALNEFDENYNSSDKKVKLGFYDRLVQFKNRIKYFFSGLLHLFKYF